MHTRTQAVAAAVNVYVDLTYYADVSRYHESFHKAALIHGLWNGELIAWSLTEFCDVMRNKPSAASLDSPRDHQILSIDQIASCLATVKLRVRLGQARYIDHLTLHFTEGKWLITSKAYHIAQILPPGS
ncbi:hypothetical protein XI06_16660 [Bradyrhizobium sp. CCBAU 11434]|uniref:nuclear transport factor 2 family protein n=1 Tax=Bradyrhizobium sp. CCBAU 11434 TaxID=1630885 RepID=UPI0023059849|nr:nuclear transport factor 2 family protein [Bradyrhizobium sp. CCBAU 11434]MDA9521897.1 hypothetical protein [Bradyrhizobium sp. CCBAU 11434]